MLWTTISCGCRCWTKVASHEHTHPTVRSLFPIVFSSLRLASLRRFSCSLPGLRRPFRGARGHGRSVFAAACAVLGERRPVLSCIAHLCEGIRAGRQTGRLSLCRIYKKRSTLSSSAISTISKAGGNPFHTETSSSFDKESQEDTEATWRHHLQISHTHPSIRKPSSP